MKANPLHLIPADPVQMNSFPDSFTESRLASSNVYDLVDRHYLGLGSFGAVYKYVNRNTMETVAVKIPHKCQKETENEVVVLEKLRELQMDKFNIVKFYGNVCLQGKTCLIFEMLDISLKKYVLDLSTNLPLKDIQVITQQMATALDFLRSIGIIHADLKRDNIMLVQATKPLRVKLIDFGLAMPVSAIKQGLICGALSYMSPEMLMGLPLSEAIDVWALGSVMGFMLTQRKVFTGKTRYENLQSMIDLLGRPPIDVIKAGLESKIYLEKNVMIPQLLQELLDGKNNRDNRPVLKSLDMWKLTRNEQNNPTELIERWECIELLKKMFIWNAVKRITPTGILNHPFITKSYLNSSPVHNPCVQSGAALDTVLGAALDAEPAAALDTVPGAALDAVPGAALDAVPGAALDTVPVTPDKKKKQKKCCRCFLLQMKRVFCSDTNDVQD